MDISSPHLSYRRMMSRLQSQLRIITIQLLAALDVWSSTQQSASRSNCIEGSSCWPPASSWAELNRTLHGHLVRSLPPAAPCHSSYFDADACSTARNNWENATWRAIQPGAYQDTAWENGDEPCYIDDTIEAPCQQGHVPYYTAVVGSVEDVQAAVKFARDNKLATRVKGASHDYLGRSSGSGTFSIQTINLKGIAFYDSFVPSGCRVSPQNAVTVAAGHHFTDVYKAADAHGRTVLGGATSSVGAAGGWALGGGHSFLSPQYGLGVDNILQFAVVTVDGRAQIANQCQNADLFWALRGGGGGLAVATSVTYKTYPAVKNLMTISLQATTNSDLYTPFLSTILSLLPAWSDYNISGYTYTAVRGTTATLFIPNSDGNIAKTNTSLAPIYQFAEAHPGEVNVSARFAVYPSIWVLYESGFAVEKVGLASVFGSRLFPRSAFESKAGTDKLAQHVADSGLFTLFLLVGGGKVNQPAPEAMAVNPSWRKALAHVVVTDAWRSNTSIADRNAIRRRITQGAQGLGNFAPGMGTYVNEADYNEPEWQKVFWGSNYPRLLEVKRKYDPTGILTCKKCVGDETFV
ncbi:hypothetical protein BOTBODRAFT_342903 [Botryobasidium botryosum FD-172 SS1]|uniref:FAD-binding PCMH-type domain-containing protein n=1 Tax=Botryobasidium botryosum (strain FD-172 SS1) TaxID=930990 RepID=A0A067MID0_BOTB1|nr:hypothetical protein BOTBODRAFT_342903 [Botryobasidium botryosum FD-172 SS1]